MSDLFIIITLLVAAIALTVAAIVCYRKYKELEDTNDNYHANTLMNLMLFGLASAVSAGWLYFITGIGILIYLTQSQ